MNANEFCRSLTPQYVTVAGIRTHYIECGSGPTVILLHGLSASFWNWWRNLPVLARHFRVVAYDLKGFGNSDKPRSKYTPEACVEQLTALMDHLEIQHAALVGHSMGTRVALMAAHTIPQRVQALVLTSPSCYPQTGGRAVPLLVLPGVGELYTWLLFMGRTDHLVERALRFCVHPKTAITEEEIYWNMLSGAEQKQIIARSYLRYGRHMRFHKPWLLAQRLNEITIPTLIISGDTDRYVPVSHCMQLAGALPRAKLELWPETGHLPHVEQPERFNTTVTRFLRTHLQPQQDWRAYVSRLTQLSTLWPAANRQLRMSFLRDS